MLRGKIVCAANSSLHFKVRAHGKIPIAGLAEPILRPDSRFRALEVFGPPAPVRDDRFLGGRRPKTFTRTDLSNCSILPGRLAPL